MLRRVEQTLEHYEEMLGFLQRVEKMRTLTVEAEAILDGAAEKRNDKQLSRLREIMQELNDESR